MKIFIFILLFLFSFNLFCKDYTFNIKYTLLVENGEITYFNESFINISFNQFNKNNIQIFDINDGYYALFDHNSLIKVNELVELNKIKCIEKTTIKTEKIYIDNFTTLDKILLITSTVIISFGIGYGVSKL